MIAPTLLSSLLFVMTMSTGPVSQGVNLAALQDWDIVVTADAIPSEKYAAEELQALLEKATGNKLEIHPVNEHPTSGANEPAGGDRHPQAGDDSASTGGHIFIGDSPRMRTSPVGFSTDGFGPEDLRIVIRDGLIAIAGGRPRGTLYGVYTFAEDYLGVRFLTADHTYCPPVGEWRVIGPVDRCYHPPLSFRWSYYGETSANPAFAARLRCNTVTDDPKYGGKTGIGLIGHTFGAQIPTSKYGKEHPEYFALVNGKRLADVRDDWSQSQPCLTNPDVLRIVTEAVLADLKAHPDKENIAVSQNDDDQYCRCPNCAAVDEREGTPMGSLLTLVNAVADAVAKEHPKVMVGTLSYWHTRKPPRTLRPRPNVQIQLCSIECCQVHALNDPSCEKNRAFQQDVENWGRICSHVSIWNYNTNFQNYLLPFPNLRVIEPNVRYFVAHNAHGVFMQAAGNARGAEFSDLRNYVMSGLLWAPNRSGPQLGHEFLDLHYGKAALPIRQFIRLVHDHAEASGKHPNCFGVASAYGLDQSIAQAGLDLFAEALKLAESEPALPGSSTQPADVAQHRAVLRNRVEKASICAYRAAIEPVWKLPDAPAPSASEGSTRKLDPAIEKLRPLVKTFLELTKQHGVTMFNEGTPMPAAEARLMKLFGVPETQAF